MRSTVSICVLVATLTGLGATPSEAADEDRLKRTIQLIQQSQQSSGLLRYDFDFASGTSSGEDDAVRQTFVIGLLAEYLLASKDASVEPALTRALERFDAFSLPIGKGRAQRLLEWTGLFAIPRGRNKLARVLNRFQLLYQPAGDGAVVTLEKDYARAWAGATALALLAELQLAEATGTTRFETARARWLQGLAALYVDGHGFRMSPTILPVTPFSDGEGWLALAYYEQRQPGHPTVTAILGDLEERLMRQYEASFSLAFYQWGTMAAAVRWESTRRPRFARFIEHQAVNVLQWLSEPRPYNTCTMVEGLGTAARVLRAAGADEALLRRIEAQIGEEMRKNYDFQLTPASRLRRRDGSPIVSPQLAEFSGAFLHDPARPYTRIDFTGHCLSAMIKLRRAGLP